VRPISNFEPINFHFQFKTESGGKITTPIGHFTRTRT